MKKEYDTSVKEAIERVMSVCSDSAGCGCNRTALQTVRIQAVLYRCHNCERGKIQRKY